jgi:hypothetical protein
MDTMPWMPMDDGLTIITPREVDRLRQIREQAQLGVLEGIAVARAILADEDANDKARIAAFRSLLQASGADQNAELRVRFEVPQRAAAGASQAAGQASNLLRLVPTAELKARLASGPPRTPLAASQATVEVAPAPEAAEAAEEPAK